MPPKRMNSKAAAAKLGADQEKAAAEAAAAAETARRAAEEAAKSVRLSAEADLAEATLAADAARTAGRAGKAGAARGQARAQGKRHQGRTEEDQEARMTCGCVLSGEGRGVNHRCRAFIRVHSLWASSPSSSGQSTRASPPTSPPWSSGCFLCSRPTWSTIRRRPPPRSRAPSPRSAGGCRGSRARARACRHSGFRHKC